MTSHRVTPTVNPSAANSHTLIPAPRSFRPIDGVLDLDSATTVASDPQLDATRRWFTRAFGAATGWDLPPAAPETANIRFRVDTDMDAEAYRLEVDDVVTIHAAAGAGAFHAAQTLLQLLGADALRQAPLRDSRAAWHLRRASIEDGPRLSYRGVMLDVARHFMPKEDVLRFIDVMALHKLNVLQLHLTDDQGWRIEVHRYPKLTEIAAWRRQSSVGSWRAGIVDPLPHGGYYSQDDLREIVAFAADRHITVIPEVDVPGHSQAAIAAYPQLGNADEPVEVWTRWGISETVLDVSETSLEFYRNVLDEVVEIFPSPWISVGGDEVPLAQWEGSADARARASDLGLPGVGGLHSWFVAQLAQHLTGHGRIASVWDEVGDNGLPEGALVLSWRGYAGGVEALTQGYDVVMCPEHKLYLDHRQSDRDDEPVPVGFVTTLQAVYEFEPLPEGIDPVQPGRLLGAQANIWSEHLDSARRVNYAAYPRLSAIAEAFWSRPEVRDYEWFQSRLRGVHLDRLAAKGVEFRPLEGPLPWQQRPGVTGWKRDYEAERHGASGEGNRAH